MKALQAGLALAIVLTACATPTVIPNTAPPVTATRARPTATLPPPPTARPTRPPQPSATPFTFSYKSPSAAQLVSAPRPPFVQFNPQNVMAESRLGAPQPIDPNMGNVLVPLPLSPEQVAFMAQNGLVASPRNYREFSDLYQAMSAQNLPLMVTSDAMLHTYHLIFDKVLRDFEAQVLLLRLQALNARLMTQAEGLYADLQGTAWQEPARRLWAYVTVGGALADPEMAIPTPVADLVTAELTAIENASGGASAIFPTLPSGEDYSQYIPRSHYTRSDELRAYFKAMMWYGRMTFRLVDADETRMGVLLTWLMRDEENLRVWRTIYEPTAFLVGRSDDLTVYDYLTAMQAVYGAEPPFEAVANDAGLPFFTQAMQQLPPPRILGIVTQVDEAGLAPTQGLRLLGQRFVPDAYVFQQLMYPEVPDPRLPSGLEVMAAMGSERALTWVQTDPTTQNATYQQQLAAMSAWLQGLSTEEWTETNYNAWLYTLRPLAVAVPDAQYPLFMQSLAWRDKQLNTALGSWAELKHDTLLYAKQPYGGLGGGGAGPQPPSPVPAQNYVEPVPRVFSRLAALAQMTYDGMGQVGAWDMMTEGEHQAYLDNFVVRTLELKGMAEKALRGQALTDDENEQLRYWGSYLYMVENWANDFQNPPLPAAIIADVATEPNSGNVLLVGIGPVHELLAVAPIPQADGSLAYTVVRGGVFSYYEFASPQRLTDEAWRERLAAGNAPAQPAFVGGFTVPQAAETEIQAAIYGFQQAWASNLYYAGANYSNAYVGFEPANYYGRASEALTQRTTEQMQAMRAERYYEGRQWVHTDYLAWERTGDTAIITVRETWQDFLVQYTSPNPFDWYLANPSTTDDPITARRGPYTVEVRYTLSLRPGDAFNRYMWRVDNFEELTPRPGWGN